ncbi:MAG: DUF1592 domain-containing protein, partial [Planctomycetales bacterium]|nr:DUF1592 domain-containing protein [Planctomycetales bacterium]
MIDRSRLTLIGLAALVAGCIVTIGSAQDISQRALEQEIAPLLNRYCADCHTGDDASGTLRLSALDDVRRIATTQYKLWEKMHSRLWSEVMPPADAEQPTAEERRKLTDWIRRALDTYDCSGPTDPGHETMRRLTRTEYRNTIRDLLGVEAKLADDFPTDDVGYGFDRIGDVLSISPLQMEKYLATAEQVAAQAVVTDPLAAAGKRSVDAAKMAAGGGASGGSDGFRVLTTTGALTGEIDAPADAEYLIRTLAYADQAGDALAHMVVRVGDARHEFDVKAGRDEPAAHEFRARLARGRQKFEIAFTNDFYDPSNPDRRRRDRNLAVRRLELVGPLDDDGLAYPESHRRLFFVRPGPALSPEAAARQILSRLALRAFRRPATEDEINRLMGIYKVGAERGESFAAGVQLALTATLASPHFLFKVEGGPPPDKPGAIYTLNEFELATRLSYFLWSSTPDDALLDLAGRGQLRSQLEPQIRRMLADPKSQALASDFAMQWLQLGRLADMELDTDRFPQWSDALRNDMLRETEMFIAAVVHDDRSVMDLIDADYVYVNERLARHYGIDGVQGEEFRKVGAVRADDPRGGILTMGSVLVSTSNPTRTSPVKRGKWIMETLLGATTPPP